MSVAGPRDYSSGTRAALAALSMGKCYYPGCDQPVVVFIDGEPFINYQIAHIRDANVGNRFDDTMTVDQRRAFANLLLLCKPHHELVDKRHPESYSSEVLTEWKDQREHGVPLDSTADVVEDDLETLLVQGATLVATNSEINLGGGGGSAPGAGGGGGGAIGEAAVGGRGGDGGNTYNLDGQPGAAPGAGGGGGGAVGPLAAGGEGGEGGEIVTAVVDLTDIAGARITVGSGGVGGVNGEGSPGDDTVVEFVREDGSIAQTLRARGGRSGAPGRPPVTPVRIVGTMLCSSAECRDGLLYVLGGAWEHYEVAELPATIVGFLAITIEASKPGVGEFLIRFSDPSREVLASPMEVELAGESPIQHANVVVPFAVSADEAGRWEVAVEGPGGAMLVHFDVKVRPTA